MLFLAEATFHLLHQQLTCIFIWSGGTILLGTLGMLFLKPGYYYYFMMMHLTWGIINLGCGLALWYHIRKKEARNADTHQVLRIHRHVRKMLFLNVIFDASYVVVGFGLPILLPHYLFLAFSFKNAVIIQGLTLLVLDSFFYSRHLRLRTKA